MNAPAYTHPPPARTLSALLAELQVNITCMEQVTIGTLIEALHERGFGVVLLFFAIPMALPVPVPPGINVLLALPLLLLTVQQMLGSHTIWMPERIKRRTLPQDRLLTLIDRILPWIEKIEHVIRPRLSWLTWDGPSRLFGFLAVLMALSVMIPLPLTNTVPSLGISLMALGIIMRDGLAVLTGAIIGAAWLAILTVSILFFGPEAFDIIKEFIKSLV